MDPKKSVRRAVPDTPRCAVSRVSSVWSAVWPILAIGAVVGCAGFLANRIIQGRGKEGSAFPPTVFSPNLNCCGKPPCGTLESFVQHQAESGDSDPLNEEQLRCFFGEEKNLSNRETRDLYHQIIGMIPAYFKHASVDRNDCLAAAMAAAKIRQNARMYTRSRTADYLLENGFMPNLAVRSYLMLRDLIWHHTINPGAPEHLLEKYRDPSNVTETCRRIVEAAQKTNEYYNYKK